MLGGFLAFKIFAQLYVFRIYVFKELFLLVFIEQVARYGNTAAGIEHIDYTVVITRGYFYGSMHAAGSSTAYQQWLGHAAAFHFFSHMHHFIQRRSDEAAKAYQVYFLSYGSVQYFISRYHYTQVYDIVAITAQYYTYYILPYIMYITFHRGYEYFCRTGSFFIQRTGSYVCQPALFFFRLYEWEQVCHALLHNTGTLYYLRQEHFTTTKQIANHIHPIHQRAFYHVKRLGVFYPRFFRIGIYKVSDTIYQRVFQTLFHCVAAP